MGGGRNGEGVVRADEVASVVPHSAHRQPARHAGSDQLRQPRLLTDPSELKAARRADARREGFDALGIAGPDAIPNAAPRLAQFLAEGQHGTMGWLAEHAE